MKKTIKNNILKKIEKGEVKMRSRLSVISEKLGKGSSMVLLFLGLIFFSGLVSIWLKTNSDLIFGQYGKYGFRSFVESFPYLFVLIFILFFATLSFILKKYDISYKKPFITLLSIILGTAILFGWFSINISYGKRFYQNEGRFFRMGQMMKGNSFFFGKVVEVNNDHIIVLSEDNKEITVTINNNTHFPYKRPGIGDEVRCVGEWQGEIFQAYGIRVFDGVNFEESGRSNGVSGIRDGKGPMWLR